MQHYQNPSGISGVQREEGRTFWQGGTWVITLMIQVLKVSGGKKGRDQCHSESLFLVFLVNLLELFLLSLYQRLLNAAEPPAALGLSQSVSVCVCLFVYIIFIYKTILCVRV